MRRTNVTSLLVAGMLLGACSEAAIGPVDQLSLQPPIAILNCQGSAAGVSCGPESSGGGPLADVIVGGQNTLVRLTGVASTLSFVNPTLSQQVTVQNLLGQPMGADNTWVNANANGVRVFMHVAPNNGVTWTSADGTGTFTGSNQQYMEYSEIIAGNGINFTPRTWTFNLPSPATTFTFQVAVATQLPNETGGSSANIPPHTFSGLATGGYFQQKMCAIRTGGSIYCWGDGNVGEFGIGKGVAYNQPIQALDPAVFTAVADGGGHVCALTSGGGVKCAGTNSNGQLGDNSITPHFLFQFVTGLSSGVTAVTAGTNHVCAITSAAALLCWGGNTAGQVGDGSVTSPVKLPTQVSGLTSGVTAVSAGQFLTCAIVNGGAKCWGTRNSGDIGDNGATSGNQMTPADVLGIAAGATAITVSEAFACAVVGGGVMCWGANLQGQMGNGATSASPQTIAAFVNTLGPASNVIQLALGRVHACALLSTGGGTVKCWGDNSNGQMGNNASGSAQTTPVTVSGLTGVDRISAAQNTQCAHLTSGIIKCWGNNASGMVGDNTTTTRLTPTNTILP